MFLPVNPINNIYFSKNNYLIKHYWTDVYKLNDKWKPLA